MLRTIRPIFSKTTSYDPKYISRFKSITAKKATKRNRTLNPGVNLQMRVLSENQPLEDNVDVDELEADFTDLQMTHREHEEQLEAMKERDKYFIIRHKYFKERHPNFLTWSDKLQIRYLHNTDPEEWTVEKLSEGFPALPETISKIIKSSWIKNNANKVRNHDMSVQKNWELFKKGELELPSDLTEHLSKFSERKLNLEQFEVEQKSPAPRVEGEFSEIIKSYERLKSKNHPIELKTDDRYLSSDHKYKPQKGTYTTLPPEEYKDKRVVTFNEFKNRIEDNAEKGKELSIDDEIILKQTNLPQPKVESINEENPVIDIGQLNKSNHLQIQTQSKKDFKHLEYPEKIIIPKNKYKRGYTYKLNDCFYDSDGLFLYRVPGMEK